MVAGCLPQVLAENVGTSTKMLEMSYGKFMRADRRRILEAGEMQLDLPKSNVVGLR